MITLSNLTPAPRKRRKRVGRGPGSGLGKTAGRGHKGQNARAGGGKGPWFEGGQTPLYRRLGKRGFNNPFRVEFQVVNLRDLEERFEAGEEVNPDTLRARGLCKRKMPIKLLADGELTKPLKVVVHKASKKAIEAVKAAGGSVELLMKEE